MTEARGRNLELEADLSLAATAVEGERGVGVERRQEAMKVAKVGGV